jgi:hypothetical protein
MLFGNSENKFIQTNDSSSPSNHFDHSIDQFVHYIQQNHHSDDSITETILITLSNLCIYVPSGSHSQYILLWMMINEMSNSSHAIRNLAYQQICKVAKAGNTTSGALFTLHKKSLYTVLLLQVYHSPESIQEICQTLLQNIEYKKFIREAMSEVLPNLIIEQKQDILKRLSIITGVEFKQLIINQLHVILSYLLTTPTHKQEQIDESYRYLANEISPDNYDSINVSKLIHACRDCLLHDLIYKIGDESLYEHTIKAIWTIVRTESQHLLKDKKNLHYQLSCQDPQILSEFIQPHFLRLYGDLNLTLISKYNDNKKKLHTLKCLGRLIEMASTKLSSFIPKVK